MIFLVHDPISLGEDSVTGPEFSEYLMYDEYRTNMRICKSVKQS